MPIRPGSDAKDSTDAPESSIRLVSLREGLFWLVAVSLAPALLFAVHLSYSNYQLHRERIYSESLSLARKVSAELDHEFAAIESGLRLLATSEHLSSGNLRQFHEQARQAVRSQIVYNYVLTDAQGRQILNTHLPFGAPLPAQGTPPELARVFRERTTVLTDLFVGPVVKRPVIAMGVPVLRDGQVVYSLNIGLDPAEIQRVVDRQSIPPDWLVVILDSSATIAARSREADQFVGEKAVPAVVAAILRDREATLETQTKEGIPSVSSHARSMRWNWTAAVGVHRSVLRRDLGEAVLFLMFLGGLMLAIGLGSAWFFRQRILDHARSLNEAALAVGQGQPVQLPKVGFTEFDAVGQTLQRAARAMHDLQHLAYHDPLTGLANRKLFQEMAMAQLAGARRGGSAIAVMVLDLDDFKGVNDSDGHDAGDRLLREVAARLRATIRESDMAARMGGDEFLVLSACASPDDAAELATRLAAVLAAPYPGIRQSVSASIGVACFPTNGDNIEELMLAADRALYEAKHQGKGRVIVSPASQG
ncbi:MAG: diguanylate cyclase [Hylemonella sp.]|nr:diguanylate cyclase [Hylemonella sp.]